MAITFRAIYTGGVLRPIYPIALAEGETVEITLAPSTKTLTAAPLPEDEMIRRIEACKTYREWLEVTKLLPSDDGGYDIVKALDANRRWSGELPLLPNEGGQP